MHTSSNTSDRRDVLIESADEILEVEALDYGIKADIKTLLLSQQDDNYVLNGYSENVACDILSADLQVKSLVFTIILKQGQKGALEVYNVKMFRYDINKDDPFILSTYPNKEHIVEKIQEENYEVMSLNLQWDDRYIIGKLKFSDCLQ